MPPLRKPIDEQDTSEPDDAQPPVDEDNGQPTDAQPGMAEPAPEGPQAGAGDSTDVPEGGAANQGEDDLSPEVSPEEQAQYDHFVAIGMKMIYDKKMEQRLLDLLSNGPQGLARATVLVVSRVGQLAEQAGEKLDGSVVLNAGTELFEELANLSKEAGMTDYTQDPDQMWGAYASAVDQYQQMLSESGDVDKQAAAADLEKLMRMDQNGQLEKIMKDLAARDDKEGDEGQPQDQNGDEPAELPQGETSGPEQDEPSSEEPDSDEEGSDGFAALTKRKKG